MLSRTLLKNNFFLRTTRVNPMQLLAARNFGYKIKVDNPVVDIDGDEMTKIIWEWIKDKVSNYHQIKIWTTQYLHFNTLYSIFTHILI